MKINKIHSTGEISSKPNAKEDKNKGSEIEHQELNYSKINHPQELLGRSLVNFKGSINPLAGIEDESILKLSESIKKDDLEAFALIYKELRHNCPGILKLSSYRNHFLKKVTKDNYEVARIFIRQQDPSDDEYDKVVDQLMPTINENNSKLATLLYSKAQGKRINILAAIRSTKTKEDETLKLNFYNKYLLQDKNITESAIANYLTFINEDNHKIIEDLMQTPNFPKNEASKALQFLSGKTEELFIKSYKNQEKIGITNEQILFLMMTGSDYSKLEELANSLNPDEISKIPKKDLPIALMFASICHAQNLDSLSEKEKKEILDILLNYNDPEETYIPLNPTGNNIVSDYTKSLIPLIPTNKAEYNKLLNELITSINSKKAVLSKEQVQAYKNSLLNISTNLAKLQDREFAEIEIKFDKKANSFIVEKNKELEKDLNILAESTPEIISMTGRIQHGAHDFDLLKHTLKVIQKIAQNNNFSSLSQEDKELLLFGALSHDIAKKENQVDERHPFNSAKIGYSILQRFNFEKEFEDKFYSLILTHEWLKNINTKETQEEIQEELHKTAYGFRFDSSFELAKIFTRADLSATKKDDSFLTRFENAFTKYSGKIDELIYGLDKNQIILPVTQFPKSTRINEAITQVNKDGSTNLKGIYKNKDGLIIVKYNEVENETWEKIGFNKGTVSKGINFQYNGQNINTGNIKFLIHGLRYDDQLTKIDAFSDIDSTALLSTSYATRVEEKHNFYRPQGVILNASTKQIHGAYREDAGSGCGKSIDEFIKYYAFDKNKEEVRSLIPNIIKEGLNLSDDEYIEFTRINRNKPLSEIEPKEIRDRAIKLFTTLNMDTDFNIWNQEKEYNEIFISNPQIMAVYVCGDKIQDDNPIDYIDNATNDYDEYKMQDIKLDFLKRYALEKDIPMFIF